MSPIAAALSSPLFAALLDALLVLLLVPWVLVEDGSDVWSLEDEDGLLAEEVELPPPRRPVVPAVVLDPCFGIHTVWQGRLWGV